MAQQAETKSYNPDVIVKRPRTFGRRKLLRDAGGVVVAAVTGGLALNQLFSDNDSSPKDSASGQTADNSGPSAGSNAQPAPAENNSAGLIKAPDFEAGTLSGEKLELGDYRGSTVLLSFWQIGFDVGGPDFIANEIRPNFGKVQNISVLTDAGYGKEARSKILNDLTSRGLTIDFPIALNDTSTGKISAMYGVTYAPTYFVINPKGEVSGIVEGFSAESKEQLIALLKQASE